METFTTVYKTIAGEFGSSKLVTFYVNGQYDRESIGGAIEMVRRQIRGQVGSEMSVDPQELLKIAVELQGISHAQKLRQIRK